jgi:hypothetical protein
MSDHALFSSFFASISKELPILVLLSKTIGDTPGDSAEYWRKKIPFQILEGDFLFYR